MKSEQRGAKSDVRNDLRQRRSGKELKPQPALSVAERELTPMDTACPELVEREQPPNRNHGLARIHVGD